MRFRVWQLACAAGAFLAFGIALAVTGNVEIKVVDAYDKYPTWSGTNKRGKSVDTHTDHIQNHWQQR